MRISYLSDVLISSKANSLRKSFRESVAAPSDVYETDIIAIASHLGLRIAFTDLKKAYGSRTLGMIIPEEKIIFCDNSLVPIGRGKELKELMLRFTIAHEVGHYIMHKGYDPMFFQKLNKKEQKRIEIQANKFAAFILMPADIFRKRHAHHSLNKNETILSRLSEEFQVSKETVQYRLKELGIMT